MKVWFERGMRNKPRGYEIFKLFSPNAFIGQGAKGSPHID